jgi:Cu+-exporting ATPase
MKKLKLKIDGMHCTSCAMNIDGELEDTDDVRSSSTNYAKGEAEVEYDEEKVKPEDIIKTIEKTGYKAFIQPEK